MIHKLFLFEEGYTKFIFIVKDHKITSGEQKK